MRETVQSWTVSSSAGAAALFDAAAAEFPSRREPPQRRVFTYLDTFDRRVAGAGETLVWQEEPGPPRLVRLARESSTPQRFPLPAVPRFAGDLPAPAADLAARIAMRRLLPQVRLHVERRSLAMLDERRKTVARLALERVRALPPDRRRGGRLLDPVLGVEAVKGFETHARRLGRWLRSRPGVDPAEGDLRHRAMVALGLDPEGAAGAARPAIEPGLAAAVATRRILRGQLETIRLNEPGVRAALDTEFLHEYRVAVRRTRSALGQLKGVLDPRREGRFRKEFKWLGSVTGPLRDLDVYLLTLPEYRDWLGSEGPALDPLERLLRRQQEEAQRVLVRVLDTARYRRLLTSWSRFLDDEKTEIAGAPDASRPVEAVAAERIGSVWEKVLARGAAIDRRTPAAKIHRLRIDAKKLRYLLEFFGALFESQDVSRAVRRLKKLQDNLGLFNDLEVQQDRLREATAAGDLPRETLLAIGRLLERLDTRQDEVREEFYGRFARFARSDAHRRLGAAP